MTATSITIRNYDKHAKLYASVSYNILMQYQLNLFVGYLQGKRVLDAGCGSGRDTEYLIGERLKVTGIDASAGMLKEARTKVKKGTFKKMDLAKLTFRPKSFDGIWCCAGLVHQRRSAILGILKDFARVLAVGGVLYASVKEGQGEGYAPSKKLGGAKVWVSHFSQVEFEELVNDAGFELLRCFTDKSQSTTWINLFARKR